MITLLNFEEQAKTAAEARDKLAFLMETLEGDLMRCKRAKMPAIKEALGKAANEINTLRAMVAENPGLFEKPRTYTFHGIKLGFQKGKGRIEIADEANTIKLIRELLPSQAGVLIKTEESVVKAALKNVDAEDLERIGVSVESAGDVVVVRPADTELDKVVNALLKAATDEEQTQAETP